MTGTARKGKEIAAPTRRLVTNSLLHTSRHTRNKVAGSLHPKQDFSVAQFDTIQSHYRRTTLKQAQICTLRYYTDLYSHDSDVSQHDGLETDTTWTKMS